ncbi:AraC family transcriptional regulator [Pedobacter panaciterrae]|jgi:AraC-type DNA-binding domain-containing proteins|uniref:Helix-turn-helix domain-containing protein n=1 Tax=Pedobacter panaciterrae TaxID=363849 RepID=A0ABU8NM40_9SPHI|nr:helix-turn-helix domain-containing protein [Pedobacter panaciterrae]NQX52919.1 AraC family transcriptional regulator [Pedobacter panaciterrae]
MKPQLLKVANNSVNSFSARRDKVPYINNRWHYHAEVELIYFKKGNGTQFIGDSIKRFRSGDVVLVGAHLPHYWRFDDNYFNDEKSNADVVVVHFCENFWGNSFLNLPENKSLKLLLERAQRGVQVQDKSKRLIGELIESILLSEGPKRIILLVEALLAIENYSQSSLLSSIGFRHDFEETENDRINAIYNYSLANFKRKIQMEEMAAVANISPNSFCRYFKSRTRKTYTQFISEIRVGHACKLLIEDSMNVKQICYESGFHNFASFHKHFKIITGKSPLSYQKSYLQK